MRSSVLSINPGHDGAIAYIRDHSLVFSLEAEKDSRRRHQPAPATILLDALQRIDDIPDMVAVSGWELTEIDTVRGAGYHGSRDDQTHRTTIKLAGESQSYLNPLMCGPIYSVRMGCRRSNKDSQVMRWSGRGRRAHSTRSMNVFEFWSILRSFRILASSIHSYMISPIRAARSEDGI